MCSDISAFLFLFDQIVYITTSIYSIIDGIIALGSIILRAINIIAITTKYIFVLDTNLSKFTIYK